MPESIQEMLANVDRMELASLLWMIFSAGLLEVVFPPFPGDAVFLVGGFIAGRRGFSVLWPYLVACLSTFIAVATLFSLGRLGGHVLLRRPFFAKLLPESRRDQIADWFNHYGLWVAICSRFIPVVRSGVALAAGMAGYSPGPALASFALSVAIFNALLVIGGSLAGENWRVLAVMLTSTSWLLALAFLAALTGRWFWCKRRRP